MISGNTTAEKTGGADQSSSHQTKIENTERVPAAVLQAQAWPAWRQWLKLPPPMVRLRTAHWWNVANRVRQLQGIEGLAFPPGRKAGIFKGSTVMWDHLAQHSPSIDRSIYRGRTFIGGQVGRSRVTNPHGALAVATRVADFDFDITEIDGTCNSQSEDRVFDSVQDFGRDYVAYEQASVDAAGLEMMIRHREVRLIHSPGADTLMLQAWDGRLFVCNGGGSHHLAGAAYIAREIGESLPLRARLSLDWLNAPAWHWLIETFFILQVPQAYRGLGDIAVLTGAAYLIELPNWVSQSSLLLLPRHVPVSRDVVELHLKAGLREVAEDIESLLSRQAAMLATLGQRFPVLCPWLGQIPR